MVAFLSLFDDSRPTGRVKEVPPLSIQFSQRSGHPLSEESEEKVVCSS
jgi:hypothetical protein